jgi:hypothetical protein
MVQVPEGILAEPARTGSLVDGLKTLIDGGYSGLLDS